MWNESSALLICDISCWCVTMSVLFVSRCPYVDLVSMTASLMVVVFRCCSSTPLCVLHSDYQVHSAFHHDMNTFRGFQWQAMVRRNICERGRINLTDLTAFLRMIKHGTNWTICRGHFNLDLLVLTALNRKEAPSVGLLYLFFSELLC